MSLFKKLAALSVLQLLCLTGCGGIDTSSTPVNDELGTAGQMVCDPSLGPGYFAGCGDNVWVHIDNPCPGFPSVIWYCQRTDGPCELYTNTCNFGSYGGSCGDFLSVFCVH